MIESSGGVTSSDSFGAWSGMLVKILGGVYLSLASSFWVLP